MDWENIPPPSSPKTNKSQSGSFCTARTPLSLHVAGGISLLESYWIPVSCMRVFSRHWGAKSLSGTAKLIPQLWGQIYRTEEDEAVRRHFRVLSVSNRLCLITENKIFRWKYHLHRSIGHQTQCSRSGRWSFGICPQKDENKILFFVAGLFFQS